MLVSELENKKIIIIGLGKEGLSTYHFLRRHFPLKELAIADQKQLSELNAGLKSDKNLKIFCGENYLDELIDFDLIIKSPGVNPRLEPIEQALESGVKMTSATNIFMANKKGKVIAVTGSKGKSTVSSLIFKVISEHGFEADLIGNIGFCSLDFLENDSASKWHVMELSSYQLEDFEGNPDLAVLVSFFPEHLNYHGNLQTYLEAKLRLPHSVNENGIIIFNGKSPEYLEDAHNWRGRNIPFNTEKSKYKISGKQILENEKPFLNSKDLKIRGKHNLENILAILTLADYLKIPSSKAVASILEFKGLPHRLENFGTYQGLTFIDDAISTTPESTLAAIDSFSEPIGAMILGGLDRGYNFEKLAEKVAERKIPVIVLFPESGSKIKSELEEIPGYLPKYFESDSMTEAVKFCYQHAPKGSIILLSCASPSYSIFKNFEDKGEQFQKLVKEMASEGFN